MTDEQVAAIRAAHEPRDGTTHWEHCAETHVMCAVQVLADEVDRLRAFVGDVARDFDLEMEEWEDEDGLLDPEVWMIGNQEDSADIARRFSDHRRAKRARALLGEGNHEQ